MTMMDDPVPDSHDLETLAEGKYLALRKHHGWEYVERVGSKGVVAVIAITDDRQLVLVEQKRPALQKYVIELPAGLAGDIPYQEDEPLVAAATRELFEETGYRAKDMRQLVAGPSSAGLCTEIISFYQARGLTRMAQGGGDGRENIRVHHVPVPEVRNWCADRAAEGKLVDFKIFAGLFLVAIDSHKIQPRLWH